MLHLSKTQFRGRLWIAYWLLIFIATHVPAQGIPRVQAKHVDKAVHFAMYFGLTVLAARYVAVTGAATARRRILAWAGVFVAYAAFDEWLQQYTYRSMDFWDWLADTGGVTSGTASALWFLRFDQNPIGERTNTNGVGLESGSTGP